MNIFPYYKTEIILNATTEQLITCLQDYIEHWDPLVRARQHKQFWGSVSKDGFSMTYISEYRSSSSPTMYGKFIHLGERTKIVLETRPHAFTYATLILIPLFLFMLSLNWFWGNEYAHSLILVIPLGAAFILFILVWAGFEAGTDYLLHELTKITQKFYINK